MMSAANPVNDLRPVPAVGVVCFRGDEVLLIQRGTPPRQGEWSLPGGRVEPGEPVKQAALRELKEETSVTARLIGLVDVIDAIIENRSGDLITRHYVLIDYVAEWVAGEPVAGDDAASATFFPISEIATLNLWDETVRVIMEAVNIVSADREGRR